MHGAMLCLYLDKVQPRVADNVAMAIEDIVACPLPSREARFVGAESAGRQDSTAGMSATRGRAQHDDRRPRVLTGSTSQMRAPPRVRVHVCIERASCNPNAGRLAKSFSRRSHSSHATRNGDLRFSSRLPHQSKIAGPRPVRDRNGIRAGGLPVCRSMGQAPLLVF